jgi:hypothetical protein
VRDRLTERKNEAIKRESDAFDQDLQRGWLIAAQNRENIGTVLAIVRQIDPKSLLLSDPRLPRAFAERARQALEHKEPAAADTLVTTGLVFAPQDAALTDLKDQTERALSAQKLEARQSNLEQSIRALAGSPDVLAASEAQNKDIESLRAIDPNDPALSDLRQQVQNALDTQLAGELRERQFDQGLALLARYADLTAPDYVDRNRQALLTAQSKAAEQPKLPAAVTAVAHESVATARTEQQEGTEMQLRAELTAGLEQSTMTLAQAKSLAAAVDELTVRRDPNATALKRKLANHLAQIAGVIKTKEGNEPATMFTKGAYALFPESAALKKTLINLLVVAAQHDSAQRAASIVTIKNNIEALLIRPNLDTAWDNAFRRELRKLTVYVSESDPYVNEVKARVSWIYVTQAGKLRSAQRLTEAARMLERSRDYEAQSAERTVEEALLADARTREELGEKDLDRAAYLSSLKQKLIIQAQANDVTGAETSLRVLHESLPADDRFMTQDAPLAIAQADARMAWGALRDGQFKSAVELINRSRLVAPFSELVSATQARYLRYAALDEYLTESPVIDVRKVRAEIGALNTQDSNTTKVVVPLLSHHLAARMHAATDTEAASRLQHVGREIFSGDAQFKSQ